MDNTITGNINAEALTPQEQINLLNQRLEQKTAQSDASTIVIDNMMHMCRLQINSMVNSYNHFAKETGRKPIKFDDGFSWQMANDFAKDWASDVCYAYEGSIEDCIDVELEHDGYGKEISIRAEVSVSDHEDLVKEIVWDFLGQLKLKLEMEQSETEEEDDEA